MNRIDVAVVDDDPFVRMSLQTILEAQEDVSVGALGASGEEAVQLYERNAPDVLLMDIRMPGEGGLGAAERILGTHPDARIVFLTTFSDDEYIARALRLGAKGYLIKQEVATIAPALRAVMAGQVVLGEEVLGRVDALVRAGAAAPSTPVALPASDASSLDAPAMRMPLHGAVGSEGAARGAARGHAPLAVGGKPADGPCECGPCGAHASPSAGERRSALQSLTGRERAIVELVAEGMDNREIAAALFLSEGTVRNHISSILQKLNLKNRTQLVVAYYRRQ